MEPRLPRKSQGRQAGLVRLRSKGPGRSGPGDTLPTCPTLVNNACTDQDAQGIPLPSTVTPCAAPPVLQSPELPLPTQPNSQTPRAVR